MRLAALLCLPLLEILLRETKDMQIETNVVETYLICSLFTIT